MNTTSTDRIEKHVVLRAPRSRVWQALTRADEFGQWFGVKLTRAFHPGAYVTGQITHAGFEHVPFQLTVERMEPERLFAWRWRVVIDPDTAAMSSETTLVTFELQDVAEGTLLTVAESGFASFPAAYRDAAYRTNEDGWEQQMTAIERYLAAAT